MPIQWAMQPLTIKQFTVLSNSGIAHGVLRTLTHDAAWWIIHDLVEGTDGQPTLSRGTEMDVDRIERLAQLGIPEDISRRLSTKGAIAILNDLIAQQREWERIRANPVLSDAWEP